MLPKEIYDTGHTPLDIFKSIFIALSKKPEVTDCELHRIISLISHVSNILLRIIMKRVRNKIKLEMWLVGEKGTTSAIYIL